MFHYHVNSLHNFYKLVPTRFYHNLFVHYMQKPLYVLPYGIIHFLYLLYFLPSLLLLFCWWDLIPFFLLILYLFLSLHLIDYDISLLSFLSLLLYSYVYLHGLLHVLNLQIVSFHLQSLISLLDLIYLKISFQIYLYL